MNQLQNNIIQNVVPVFSEDIGSFTGQMVGVVEGITVPTRWQTGTTQNSVTMTFEGGSGTSNSTAMTITGLPKNLWPQSVQACLCRVTDNGATSVGVVVINSDGTIQFFSSVSLAAFTASGVKGVPTNTISYVRGI